LRQRHDNERAGGDLAHDRATAQGCECAGTECDREPLVSCGVHGDAMRLERGTHSSLDFVPRHTKARQLATQREHLVAQRQDLRRRLASGERGG
jgi:hypothetical protein